MYRESGAVAGPLNLTDSAVLRIRAAKTRIEANCARAEAICRRLRPDEAEPIREAIFGVRAAAIDVDTELARAERAQGARSLGLVVVIVALMLLVSLGGCVDGPDGRRVLAPGARAIVEHVLTCGLPVASSAAAGEQPDYLEASRCHLELVGEQLGQRPAAEEAPTPPRAKPNAEHGRLVVRAAELERAGAPRPEVRRAAVDADALARTLVDAEVSP